MGAAPPWASDATAALSPSLAGNYGSARTVQGQTQRQLRNDSLGLKLAQDHWN